jgi:hypothetical protein
LLRETAIRGALIVVPFAVWFVWAWWAKRSGRPMGSTPWPWLFTASALLIALSLIGTVVFHGDNRGERYVPGEVTAGGRVTAGHFERR